MDGRIGRFIEPRALSPACVLHTRAIFLPDMPPRETRRRALICFLLAAGEK
jgi:hypothetical protein